MQSAIIVLYYCDNDTVYVKYKSSADDVNMIVLFILTVFFLLPLIYINPIGFN